MDRLDKGIEIATRIAEECSNHEECERCPYKDKDECIVSDVHVGMEYLSHILPREKSITLKNINISGSTLDELFDEVIEKNEECKYALTNLIELIKCNVNKEYLKEHYIEKILDQLQANINIASAYGITVNDIMKYYNTEYLDKLDKKGRK